MIRKAIAVSTQKISTTVKIIKEIIITSAKVNSTIITWGFDPRVRMRCSSHLPARPGSQGWTAKPSFCVAYLIDSTPRWLVLPAWVDRVLPGYCELIRRSSRYPRLKPVHKGTDYADFPPEMNAEIGKFKRISDV